MREIMGPTNDILLAKKNLLSKWKEYKCYEYSGIPWYERIPNHWRTWKIAHAFLCIGSGTTPLSSHQEYYDGTVAWVNTSELRDSFIDDTAKKLSQKALQEIPTLRVYKTGTLLIALYGATIGKVGILRIEATTNQACCALSSSSVFDTKFLFFFFLAYRKYLIMLSYGGGQPNINQEIIRSLRIPTPPLLEQQAIATFLDHETAKLNALIAKKERLIELLKEHRAAIINQAVTKGLNPDVAMKDSGVVWLGEVPQHWNVRRLKYNASFFGGGTPSKNNISYWSGNIPWVSPKDMKSEGIDDTEDHISQEALQNSATYLIELGAVLVVVRSGILKHSIPVAINRVSVAINQDMKAIVPKKFLLAKYFMDIIIGHQDSLLVEWRKSGATVESVEFELLANTYIPVPPIEEQKEIVTYLEKETEKIDKLISTISGGIQKLKEYSSALISAAVTGKIDVRGEVGQVPGEEEINEDGA